VSAKTKARPRPPAHLRGRWRSVRVSGLYARALLREFRGTLAAVAALVLVGGALFTLTPHEALGGARPTFDQGLFAAWMAMLSQPMLTPPEAWYLAVVDSVYPLLGFALIGEGVVRFGLLMVSRRRGEKEWMKVMASTYRDHVILCGIGRLGFRVLQSLLEQKRDVVVIEKNADARFVAAARATGVPVLVRDMTDDAALLDAGIEYARAIVIATNDDIANLEVATDSRRMNPGIRVCLRMYDQQVAAKLAGVFGVDVAFSASALAATAVAGMTLGPRVLSACTIGGAAHVATELHVTAGSTLVGCSIGDVEAAHAVRVLARTPSGAAVEAPPALTTRLGAGDLLVVHAPLATLPVLNEASRAR
jgi:Trk K+ transport system NAD-binding subunit